MIEGRLFLTEQSGARRQLRVQRKQAVELGAINYAIGDFAPRTGKGRVTRWREDREPVCRAALDDEDETPVGFGGGQGDARGKRDACAGQPG